MTGLTLPPLGYDGGVMLDAAWTGFFTAEIGATSALAGLVIVAISINIARILDVPQLPGRAGETLIVLVGALLTSSIALFPADTLPVSVFLAVALVSWALPVGMQLRDLRRDAKRVRLSRVVLAQLPTAPMLVGGYLVAVGSAAGATWLAAAVLLALLAGMANTWVLLVEILR